MSRPQVPLQDRQGVARHHQHAEGKTYQPLPVRRQLILKAGQPGKFRPLGIPAIYDRVCHQAPLNRLEPIFEPVIDDASFGYRKGRSTKDSLRKIWKELGAGAEWILDADLKDFFGSVDHEKLLTLVDQRISDGRVLWLIERMLKAGVLSEGQRLPTEQGTPQKIYTLSLGHFVILSLMFVAAATVDLDPDWLSFTGCFQILKCRLPECNGTTPATFEAWYEALLWEMQKERTDPRRNRINPRVIKRKMSKWMKKRPEHRHLPPLKKTFPETVVMTR